MDAITLLEQDHQKVKKIMAELEKTTERGVKTREELFTKLVQELVVHEKIEEQIFYPRVKEQATTAERQAPRCGDAQHVLEREVEIWLELPREHDDAPGRIIVHEERGAMRRPREASSLVPCPQARRLPWHQSEVPGAIRTRELELDAEPRPAASGDEPASPGRARPSVERVDHCAIDAPQVGVHGA